MGDQEEIIDRVSTQPVGKVDLELRLGTCGPLFRRNTLGMPVCHFAIGDLHLIRKTDLYARLIRCGPAAQHLRHILRYKQIVRSILRFRRIFHAKIRDLYDLLIRQDSIERV